MCTDMTSQTYLPKCTIICSSANTSVSHTQNSFTSRNHPSPTVPDIVRFKVALGIHHLQSVQGEQHVVQHLSRIVLHPQYLGTMNDIALLRLTQPVGYSVLIRPICLPPPTGKRSMPLETDSS